MTGSHSFPRTSTQTADDPDSLRSHQRIQCDQQLMLGRLTADVAHELNNPIGYISSNLATLHKYAQVILEIIDQSEEFIPAEQCEKWRTLLKKKRWDFIRLDLPQLLKDTSEGADLLTRVVADLKTLGRSGTSFEHADPNECVRSALTMLRHKLKRGFLVEERFQALEPIVLIRAQIIQAVTNLLHNAIQAMEDDPGTITVSTSVTPDTQRIIIAIEDDGPGISPDIISDIFTPQFTTKDSHSGSGLGLSIVSDIAAKHHGEISLVPAQRHRGARFELSLSTQLTLSS